MAFVEIEYRCSECGFTTLRTVIVGVSGYAVFPCGNCHNLTLQYSSITRMYTQQIK